MVKVSYDLHIHSCLSPCGDEDMTPANIAGMAAIKKLDVIAVTDHNSCKNCEAVLRWADQYGIIALPGMELTTEEEVHTLCLFSNLKDAMAFDSYVYKRLYKNKNDISLFGKQLICNQKDQIVGEEELLLIQSTSIRFDMVYDLVNEYDGVMIPAHIEKNSNSLLYNLGFVPEGSKFKTVEIKDMKKVPQLLDSHPYLKGCLILHDSDAHYLEDIHEADFYIETEEKSRTSILKTLRNRSI